MRYILIPLVVLVLALGAFLLSSERNRAAIFERSGSVRAGGKFGISIGAPEGESIQELQQRGWYHVGHQEGGYCIRTPYPPGNSVHIFFDESWRKITFCVVSKNRRVVALQWYAWTFTPEF